MKKNVNKMGRFWRSRNGVSIWSCQPQSYPLCQPTLEGLASQDPNSPPPQPYGHSSLLPPLQPAETHTEDEGCALCWKLQEEKQENPVFGFQIEPAGYSWNAKGLIGVQELVCAFYCKLTLNYRGKALQIFNFYTIQSICKNKNLKEVKSVINCAQLIWLLRI